MIRNHEVAYKYFLGIKGGEKANFMKEAGNRSGIRDLCCVFLEPRKMSVLKKANWSANFEMDDPFRLLFEK